MAGTIGSADGHGDDVLEREWVSIRDPDDGHLRYTFDVSFLLSHYRCIYGQGCPGVLCDGSDPALGCCVHGAYYVDADERVRVEGELLNELDPEIMQLHDQAVADGITSLDEDGEAHTRLVDGACIFLNRGGWPAGEGCSLHVLAMRRGEHHMTYKPTVCWQVPLHRSIAEEVANDGEKLEIHTISAFERGTWGEGGADFAWWCTDEPSAFTARQPLYRSMERELREMVGDGVYDELATFLDRRRRRRDTVRFLPVAD
ncbi:MAG: hypothetical protein KY462_01820 [Actinobacteria bacterium]|nr:hypothetical protein [Actinomycetota bacterium]